MKAFPKDIEVNNLEERHIGVESELRVLVPSDQEVTPVFRDKLNEKGLLNSIGWDGGGREFRTNPISVKSLLKQVRGRQYLTKYFDNLKQCTDVATSGGTHIHISILDKDHPNMESNATALAMAFFSQFQKVAGRRIFWASRFHHGTTIEEVREYLSRSRSSYNNRTYGLKGSMLNPTGHKTLEFRGPKGSNDANEVLAWVDFLNNVVNLSNRESIDGITFADLLKGERIAAYVETLPKERQFTTAELTNPINPMALA